MLQSVYDKFVQKRQIKHKNIQILKNVFTNVKKRSKINMSFIKYVGDNLHITLVSSVGIREV